MQENEKIVFVKTDLLIQENGFESLRECVSNLDLEMVDMFDEFTYNSEGDSVIRISQRVHPGVFPKIQNGYILINLNDFKKLLSL